MAACEVWLHLLARLEHMRLEIERPGAAKLYKSLGSRCHKNAQRQLYKEREALLKILKRWGLAITEWGYVRVRELMANQIGMTANHRAGIENRGNGRANIVSADQPQFLAFTDAVALPGIIVDLWVFPIVF